MSLNLFSRIFPTAQKHLFLSRASNIVGAGSAVTARHLSASSLCRCSQENPPNATETSVKDASRDRTKLIPLETSIRYIQSEAYAVTYGDQPVWKQYRRNHKGAIPPRKTRRTCIRKGLISTGNPCPICRDEYLVLDPQNVELLKQFISPYTGEVLSYSVTGVCQKKHKELLVAIERAKDEGLIVYDVPFRSYDYAFYKPQS